MTWAVDTTARPQFNFANLGRPTIQADDGKEASESPASSPTAASGYRRCGVRTIGGALTPKPSRATRIQPESIRTVNLVQPHIFFDLSGLTLLYQGTGACPDFKKSEFPNQFGWKYPVSTRFFGGEIGF